MTARLTTNELLARVRVALGRAPDAPAPPVPSPPADLVPALADPSDLVATFVANARRAGAEVVASPLAEAIDHHVVEAACAIAASGSVALDGEDPLGTMLADTLVVHVARAAIVPTVRDALAYLAARARAPRAATRVLITGPSKTADIEGILITGVHGPGRVIVVVRD